MKLKGDFYSGDSYSVGDVVRGEDGNFYHLVNPCPQGTGPFDTRYWCKAEQNIAQCAGFILDAVASVLATEQTNNAAIAANLSESALILKSSTEDSDKQFMITVDDDGDIDATEVDENGDPVVDGGDT